MSRARVLSSLLLIALVGWQTALAQQASKPAVDDDLHRADYVVETPGDDEESTSADSGDTTDGKTKPPAAHGPADSDRRMR